MKPGIVVTFSDHEVLYEKATSMTYDEEKRLVLRDADGDTVEKFDYGTYVTACLAEFA